MVGKINIFLSGRARSIHYAMEGIYYLVRTEINARVHIAATIMLIVACIILQVKSWEAVVLAIAAGMVWAAEIFNTAIERIMDFIAPGQHPAVKVIKDLSAAAVLVTALTALVAAVIIFLPKILTHVSIKY